MSAAGTAVTKEPIWRRVEGWPQPKWAHVKPRSYEDYVSRQLRIRYSELEGSMRTIVEPHNEKDQLIAEQVYGYLQLARELLEAGEESLIEASAYLNLADRYIVWLYSRDCLGPETEKVLARLEHFRPMGWERFKAEIKSCRDVHEIASNVSDLDRRKAALDQAIAAINDSIVEDRISSYLQIRCLGHLMTGGMLLLVALCLAAPAALNINAVEGHPHWSWWAARDFGIDYFTAALVVALMGGLGGFLSALMDARRTKMTADVYQERLLLLEIKPLVGSLVSLTLFCLLSWAVVPAVSPKNFGSYMLVAFVAGFSEKYFLRLLPFDQIRGSKSSARLRSSDGQPANGNHLRSTDTGLT
jgi:hypothetical protein